MSNVILASVSFSCGSIVMKSTAGFTKVWPSLLLAACFVVGAAFLARAVMSAPVSTAVTVGLGIEAVAALAIGLLVLGERITPVQVMGLAFVVGGVALLRQ